MINILGVASANDGCDIGAAERVAVPAQIVGRVLQRDETFTGFWHASSLVSDVH